MTVRRNALENKEVLQLPFADCCSLVQFLKKNNWKNYFKKLIKNLFKKLFKNIERKIIKNILKKIVKKLFKKYLISELKKIE